MFVVVFLVGVMFGASYAAVRAFNVIHTVTGQSNPIQIVQDAVAPAPGSLAYKLQHNQPVNILVLGIGGQENDAPTLSDTIMAVTLDPVGKRVVQTSIPRDLWVPINAWTDNRAYEEKINVANQVGSDDSYANYPCCKKPDYVGRDGGGRLAEATVGMVTGIQFDRYVTIDFVAFRDVVDAVHGIDIHLDTSLHDCHYPDYHNGYLNGGVPLGYPCPSATAGIYFPAGDLHVNGEQALEIARSRDAEEPAQQNDFARAHRQQLITNAIRKKALSVNAITQLDGLLNALQKNVRSDLTAGDINTLYGWAGKIPDSGIVRLALTNLDLLREYYLEPGSCGNPEAYVLCPIDPSYGFIHNYIGRALVDPAVLAERAPVQILNASRQEDLDDRMSTLIRQYGLAVAPPVPDVLPASPTTVVYDYSGGGYRLTAAWLAAYFDGTVLPAPAVPAPSAGGPLLPGAQTTGLVVVLGTDYQRRFGGLAAA